MEYRNRATVTPAELPGIVKLTVLVPEGILCPTTRCSVSSQMPSLFTSIQTSSLPASEAVTSKCEPMPETSAKFEMHRRWSVEPYWIYWNVGDSDIDITTAPFTVNGISAQQQAGFYEPRNTTNELGVKLTFRIR